MNDAVLTLNAGSSSLKFSLFRKDGEDLIRLADGQLEGLGAAPHLVARDGGEVVLERRWDATTNLTHEAMLSELIAWADGQAGGEGVAAVGHRIVHGGAAHWRPALIDGPLLDELDALCPLAPLHQPHNLAAVRAVLAAHPSLPQVACFDTAFHHGHAPVVDRFALPRDLEAEGVRRYGFHGLSYEYVAGRVRELAPELAAGRLIIAHLGAGASLCAVKDGHSIDTTMGFTALDGLMMGTRCGALDPGVILYLLQAKGMSAAAIEDLLYRRSGLLGVSGLSGDMRALLASEAPAAREAVELFVFRIAREIGALTMSLGGLDGVVFTAGIGEHAPEIRRRVCERLAWLGARLDPAANASGQGPIQAKDSRIALWVVPTDEEAMIARHTADLVFRAG
ncbi:acetate/propionate family kinase [Phenylobacterium montanum]|uniref:Acetate kinase n=1 Tax=Phenylobacterium montanum TaxID=2823693 RepID=A0A975IT90_9CAUL|nr:acetate/propionate family kinase [Caulobacter sp. S6]QUD86490.1 acetate/propionate family kinase [Caulobacter sp. S6]